MQLLRKALPHHSSTRRRAGGILALLASGVVALAAGAAVASPDCADWNTREFFEEATADDVARCLSQGADPRAWASEPDGLLTPLHLAAKHSDSPEVVKVLVDAGADPNERTFFVAHDYEMLWPRPLDLTYSLEMAKALVDAGADDSGGPYSRVKVLELVDSPDYCGNWNANNVIYESIADRLAALTRVYQTEEKAWAIWRKARVVIKSKLIEGEEVSTTELGLPPSVFDIDRFQDEVLQVRAMDVFFEKATAEDMGRCISQGYDPNARTKNGNTPLHRASIPMTTALLDAGADLNTRNKQGETPLHLLAQDSDIDSPEAVKVLVDAVKVLVDAGADLEAQDKDGLTPLHGAIMSYIIKGRNIETDRFLFGWRPSSTTQQTPRLVLTREEGGEWEWHYPYRTGATSLGRELWRLGEDEWEWRPLVPPTTQQTPQSPAQPQVAWEWVLDPVKAKMRLDEMSAVVKALLDAGADPTAGRFLPVDLIDELTPSDSPLRDTDVYWRLHDARF
ncbi:MAG: hypothetical protein F4Y52_01410 [Synechococcus sp. SB0664_bin_36]|nr:hypothetical protein [Synechococcus sp. SB0664_bin_36]